MTHHTNRLLTKRLILGLLGVALYFTEGQTVGAADIAERVVSHEDLNEFFAIATERTTARNIQVLLGINVANYKKPAGLLAALLNQLGIKLESEKIQRDGKRQQYYHLDLTTLETMLDYAQHRLNTDYIDPESGAKMLKVSKTFFIGIK